MAEQPSRDGEGRRQVGRKTKVTVFTTQVVRLSLAQVSLACRCFNRNIPLFHRLFPVVSMYLAHPSGWGVNAKPPPQTGNWQNPPQPGGGNGVGAFGHGADGVGGAPPQFGGGRGGGFGGAGPGLRGGFRSASNTFDAGAQVRFFLSFFPVFDGRLLVN